MDTTTQTTPAPMPAPDYLSREVYASKRFIRTTGDGKKMWYYRETFLTITTMLPKREIPCQDCRRIIPEGETCARTITLTALCQNCYTLMPQSQAEQTSEARDEYIPRAPRPIPAKVR